MEPGDVIAGRYRLDAHIGAGGMGSVWRSHDLRLRRTVAVKVLKRGLASAAQPEERFQREAQALAALSGPAFTAVHDYGEDAAGEDTVRYIVMEYVDGDSVEAVLDRRGRLTADETLLLVAEVAEALDLAHRTGVVHRDVKPANLILDAESRVRVVDFGIATLSGATSLTVSGTILGTLRYAAPEVFRSRDATAKSDLYALGALAYECLTGSPPFTGDSPESIMAGHLYEEPEPLPDTVPAAIASIVLRALQKEPDDRWESGAAMAAACRAAASEDANHSSFGVVIGERSDLDPDPEPEPESEPELEPAAGTLAEDRRPGRRLALVLAAVLVVLLAGSLLAWRYWPDRDGPGEGATGRIAAGAETTTTGESPDPSGSADPGASPETADSDDPGSNDGTDDDGEDTTVGTETGGTDPDEDDTGGGSTTGTDEHDEERTVPDVRFIEYADAVAELNAAGFTEVSKYETMDWSDSASGIIPSGCEVVAQDPVDTTASPDTTITLGVYWTAMPGGSDSMC
ncbi:serine/threonine-protein kinase [Glycomyces paridis]|uniref:serine/threonine-protein kinase n=1 Tax=Glycomyces paridis TaxID=2126555 RepID=UPI0013050DC1|nr:serine/threonine-protein kinase [Glycomyces paridis]